MRPLTHPDLPPEVREKWLLGAALLQSFGPFCAISERPLPDVMLAWHSDQGIAHRDDIEIPSDWTSFLPIAPELAPPPAMFPANALALPHRSLTFSLGPRRYDYAITDVELVFLDDEGETDSSETRQLVVVSGCDEEAERTILAFRLNSAGYDPAKQRLTMPKAIYLAMEDHLIFRRTEVWERAEAAVALVTEPSDPDPAVVMKLRLLVGASGYWSCWATIMMQHGIAAASIIEILGGPSTSLVPELALLAVTDTRAFYLGHGPHNSFPGTDMRWITPSGRSA